MIIIILLLFRSYVSCEFLKVADEILVQNPETPLRIYESVELSIDAKQCESLCICIEYKNTQEAGNSRLEDSAWVEKISLTLVFKISWSSGGRNREENRCRASGSLTLG